MLLRHRLVACLAPALTPPAHVCFVLVLVGGGTNAPVADTASALGPITNGIIRAHKATAALDVVGSGMPIGYPSGRCLPSNAFQQVGSDHFGGFPGSRSFGGESASPLCICPHHLAPHRLASEGGRMSMAGQCALPLSTWPLVGQHAPLSTS